MEFTNVVDCGEPHFSKTFYRLLWVSDIGKKGIFKGFYGFLSRETLDFSCPKQLKRHWVLRRGNLTCNVILGEKAVFTLLHAGSFSELPFVYSQPEQT